MFFPHGKTLVFFRVSKLPNFEKKSNYFLRITKFYPKFHQVAKNIEGCQILFIYNFHDFFIAKSG
jgi:hypothetical protein